MKALLSTTLLLLPVLLCARVLEVGTGRQYATVQAAAAQARPGDTILVRAGTYSGGEFIANLQGSPSAWIVILAAPGETVTYHGATEAFHFTDPAYLRIEGLRFESQTGNGVNIDDGGSYQTPAHSIHIENCHWGLMDASGNNDQLKLSGVDTITVRNCSFQYGAAGGSSVDMVGCHHAMFELNRFKNAGANSIQAKGGSQYIAIRRNRFVDGGERTLNIGGSTGAAYFRPLNANFEAADIDVFANVFTGSQAQIAFVGAVRCRVINNTLWHPTKWAVRILQETVGASYLPCGQNSFVNNIVVVTNAAANPTINIGPNTEPGTFTISNNLWFNDQNAAWSGPNLPVTETNGMLNRNPLLRDPANGDFTIPVTSPAVGAAAAVAAPVEDLLGRLYSSPRSIGAVEGNPVATRADATPAPQCPDVDVFPNPSSGDAMSFLHHLPSDASVALYDSFGRLLGRYSGIAPHRRIGLPALVPGMYILMCQAGAATRVVRCLVVR
jgi:hypothetical protein